jgi:hypothetical protein
MLPVWGVVGAAGYFRGNAAWRGRTRAEVRGQTGGGGPEPCALTTWEGEPGGRSEAAIGTAGGGAPAKSAETATVRAPARARAGRAPVVMPIRCQPG